MPEPVTKFFKGLTTQHVGVLWVVLGGSFWLGEIKPRVTAAESSHNGLKHEVTRIADALEGFKKEVADIRSEVRVHSVLIASMNEVKTEMKELRKELSVLSARKTVLSTP